MEDSEVSRCFLVRVKPFSRTPGSLWPHPVQVSVDLPFPSAWGEFPEASYTICAHGGRQLCQNPGHNFTVATATTTATPELLYQGFAWRKPVSSGPPFPSEGCPASSRAWLGVPSCRAKTLHRLWGSDLAGLPVSQPPSLLWVSSQLGLLPALSGPRSP